MSTRRLGRAVVVAGACATLLAASSCREPEQVTFELVGEVPYREGMRVAVQVAAPGAVESSPERSSTSTRWAFGETIGTVVVAPGESDAADVRVVLALGRAPETCTKDDAAGCVVYRRRVTFGDGTKSVRAVLRASCFGVFCDRESSCREDRSCGPIASDALGAREDGRALAPDPYAAAVLADRPRHYYRFDEPEGATVARDELGRADGIYENAKVGVTGAIESGGTAVYFDGVRARVRVPGLEELPGPFTIEAWVRNDGSGTKSTSPIALERLGFGARGGRFGYRLSAFKYSALLELYRDADLLAVEGARQSDGFGYLHVAAVAEKGTLKVYVDGLLDSEEKRVDDGPLPPSAVPLVVGGDEGAYFRGAIDELAFYDHALAAEAIREHVAASRRR